MKKFGHFLLFLTFPIWCISCQPKVASSADGASESSSPEVPSFYVGADLSYTNELEDCGVKYTANGVETDIFALFHQYGANMVRLRLWHNPSWTSYSTLADVKRSARRAKDAGMSVLLDFHYSDTWTDPAQNLVPAAWAAVVNDTVALADSIYNYTYGTLQTMFLADVLPAAVQIGNETNNNILVADNAQLLPLDINRNVTLFNAGIRAVADFNRAHKSDIKTVLHVAMADGEVLNWLANVKAGGILDFDVVGVSYYPQWQRYTPRELGTLAKTTYETYGIRLLVAETGHIWTRLWNDESHNLVSRMAVGYPEAPCPQLQKDFLIEVRDEVRDNHGYGVLVWEPGWVSSANATLWGVGSNWENVTFFDFNRELLQHGGIDFLNDDNCRVTFKVDMANADRQASGYITGSFTADASGAWQIFPMRRVGTSDVYEFSTYLSHGQTVAYYYLSDSTWEARETVPDSLPRVGNDRCLTITSEADSISVQEKFGM